MVQFGCACIVAWCLLCRILPSSHHVKYLADAKDHSPHRNTELHCSMNTLQVRVLSQFSRDLSHNTTTVSSGTYVYLSDARRQSNINKRPLTMSFVSSLPVIQYCPSGVQDTVFTQPVCPFRVADSSILRTKCELPPTALCSGSGLHTPAPSLATNLPPCPRLCRSLNRRRIDDFLSRRGGRDFFVWLAMPGTLLLLLLLLRLLGIFVAPIEDDVDVGFLALPLLMSRSSSTARFNEGAAGRAVAVPAVLGVLLGSLPLSMLAVAPRAFCASDGLLAR